MMPIIEYLLSKKNNKVDSSQEICLVILEQDGFNFTIKYVISLYLLYILLFHIVIYYFLNIIKLT